MGKKVDLEDNLSVKIRSLYLEGKRVFEIVKLIDGALSYDGVTKRLKMMGIYRKRMPRIDYDMDKLLHLHNYTEGCYLLGLLLADGSMNIIKTTDTGRDLKKIGLEVSTKDEDSLKRIRDHFVPQAKLSYRKKRDLVSLSFCNTEFCDYLESICVRINKRKKGMPPIPQNILDNRELSLAFLAGYNDGDGCFSVYQGSANKGHKGIQFNITCATPVWNELHKLYDRLGLTYYKNCTHDTWVSATFTDLCNTTKIFMDAYTITPLVFERRKLMLKEVCDVILSSSIRSKKYGKQIIDHDKTGFFTGISKTKV